MTAFLQSAAAPTDSTVDKALRGGATRSAPCPCGSGRRFKLCCGALVARETNDRVVNHELPAIKMRALAAQQAGRLPEAVAGYSDVLAIDPSDFDAAHMRAVSLYQLGCSEEAAGAFFDLLRAGHRFNEAAWHNFGLAIASSAQWADDPMLVERVQQYRSDVDAKKNGVAVTNGAAVADGPRVSVVIACYNHEKFVAEAIASVAHQTRLPHELVVIDDGSTDGSVREIERAIANLPFNVVFRARANRGAAATFNEAIDLASGDLILPLNSDDRFDSRRVEKVMATTIYSPLQWGFGGVDYILANGDLSTNAIDNRTYALRAVGNTPFMAPTIGLSFLLANPAISTGNLFFSKSLWRRIGGFFDWRYHHDWFFALQAAKFSEPIHLPTARYQYRVHESNTIAESSDRVQAECKSMMARALAELCDFSPGALDNAFAPCPAVWKRAFFATVGGVGFMAQLPHDALIAFADDMQRGSNV